MQFPFRVAFYASVLAFMPSRQNQFFDQVAQWLSTEVIHPEQGEWKVLLQLTSTSAPVVVRAPSTSTFAAAFELLSGAPPGLIQQSVLICNTRIKDCGCCVREIASISGVWQCWIERFHFGDNITFHIALMLRPVLWTHHPPLCHSMRKRPVVSS